MNEGGERTKKKVGLVIGLLLVLSATICLNINPVSAQTLTIDSIDKYTSGTDTILNITVIHITPGSGGEYNPLNFVDHLDVDIDGDIQFVNTADYQVTHFSVQYNMGEVAGTPTVRVRACSLQTTGDWFGPIEVPEFPLINLLPILLAVSVAILLVRLKISKKLM